MHNQEHKILMMSKILKVSRNGYYQWARHKKQPRGQGPILEAIERVFAESRKSYGSPRIYRRLRSEGIACGRNRIARYMKENGIIARKHKKYRKPVSEQRIQPVAQNILNREFRTQAQNSVWAADVSYFWTRNGWVHLAVVMDLFSRKIIGWSMGNHIDKDLSKSALMMALHAREPQTRVMHHSDQGAEYTNKDYQSLLKEHCMIVSMSRRANCYDNAVVESFFKTIKAELARQQKFGTQDEAKSAIFEYIEVFYNRKRMHSTLGYLSPVEYERLNSVN